MGNLLKQRLKPGAQQQCADVWACASTLGSWRLACDGFGHVHWCCLPLAAFTPALTFATAFTATAATKRQLLPLEAASICGGCIGNLASCTKCVEQFK